MGGGSCRKKRVALITTLAAQSNSTVCEQILQELNLRSLPRSGALPGICAPRVGVDD